MEESLVAEQIRWEAEQYIPYDINEVNLDFKILGKQTLQETYQQLSVKQSLKFGFAEKRSSFLHEAPQYFGASAGEFRSFPT